jgi:hypothetical protein
VKGATGGAATVHSSAASVTIASYAITIAEMGAHSHTGITDRNDNITSGNTSYAYANGPDVANTRNTGATGSGSGHTHAGSSVAGGQGVTGNNLPAYKAYCYIVKE